MLAEPQTQTHVPSEWVQEWANCEADPAYFIYNYCKILDPVEKDWIPFHLWDAQFEVLDSWLANQYNLGLKARQVGLTWEALALANWGIIFHNNYEVMLVSRRLEEAWYIAGDERLRGMYRNLPDWMKGSEVVRDNAAHWRLSNGSGARAFPSNNVDSYSANLLIIDEADHPHIDLKTLLNSAKPTIDAGGKLILISRSYKEQPMSYFKTLYRVGKAGKNEFAVTFIPWFAHPSRTQEWYDEQCRNAMETEGTLDSVYEQYPATDVQALAANTLDKRIAPQFLSRCYVEMKALPRKMLHANAPDIPGLQIYRNPQAGEKFVLGADPAEGNPTSDDSAASVVEMDSGEEVAALAGKFEVDTFASYIKELSTYFNRAPALVERNNHGHAVILWLADNSRVRLIEGKDEKEGWQTNTVSKAELYADAVVNFRERDAVIHNFETLTQLQSIDGATLKAPPNMHDDRAVSFVLAQKARSVAVIAGQGARMGHYRHED